MLAHQSLKLFVPQQGTKLAIVVMSALLLRLRLLEGEPDPGSLSEGSTKRGACINALGTGDLSR